MCMHSLDASSMPMRSALCCALDLDARNDACDLDARNDACVATPHDVVTFQPTSRNITHSNRHHATSQHHDIKIAAAPIKHKRTALPLYFARAHARQGSKGRIQLASVKRYDAAKHAQFFNAFAERSRERERTQRERLRQAAREQVTRATHAHQTISSRGRRRQANRHGDKWQGRHYDCDRGMQAECDGGVVLRLLHSCLFHAMSCVS